MKTLAKIGNSLKLLIIFGKSSILDIKLASEYTSTLNVISRRRNKTNKQRIEAAVQRLFQEKVFWKYAANLQLYWNHTSV